ncbi:hypothetical protein [Ensifer sp. 1H6]|uniref:hypothetical protein n=1 Tax=Ensifer sp. 1H6 TaxID=1911585 RepID=UPI0009D5F664|nr:hypothetical protein [Ensifer sp. 1H6]OMQ44943.1 hypothetical protein BKP54_11160 [Ensifer sp. 1H6]
MTAALLPIVEELFDAADHSERAHWLLAVPLDVLVRERVCIRQALVKANFPEGLAYLEAEIAALSAVRGRDGLAPITIRTTREYARIGVQVMARGSAMEGGN